MTSPSPMSREELLELAALDALSLLDEYEAALFTRSFHHAPTAVQEEIKELQAAFATDDSLLPDVEPSPELRGRILSGMAKAIESESVEFAPLATIGRPRLENRAPAPPRASLTSSGQFWRAASFVLVGVLASLLVFASQRQQSSDKIEAWVMDLFAQEQVEAILAEEAADDIIGRDFMEFLQTPGVQFVALSSDNEGAAGVLMYDAVSQDAFLLTFGLSTHTEYAISATNGSATVSKTFEPLRQMHGLALQDVTASLFASMTWAITDLATGEVVLSRA